ncbi:MAG: beta-N-acetylhexosaminidase [Ignavibacterium sp.]|nr:beta-N-acetylhexosaminidase [Ignavibacterium sp.]
MNNKYNFRIIEYILSALIILQLVSCKTVAPTDERKPMRELKASFDNIIPVPVSINPTGSIFRLNPNSIIYIEPMNYETRFIGQYLKDQIKSTTGYGITFLTAEAISADENIRLIIDDRDELLGQEGYELIITENLLTIKANKAEGLFRGVQTISQMLFPLVNSSAPLSKDVLIPTVEIKDYPRFEWRGVMLDVARHFFSVSDVKKLVDRIVLYKFNRLHLHLTDDQGWRIQINSWPNLTIYGGSTQVGGGVGGYFTQEDYTEIVKYAEQRYIIVVPEIDMPGHTNAALASYPVLNCDGISPELYTGIKVGFSSLCINKDSTYIFIDDVIREVSELTPGPYIHIGGDEAMATDSVDYINFIVRVQDIIQSYGKQMIGWEEITQSRLKSNTIVQHWRKSQLAMKGVHQGSKLIMSPSTKAYMDMKYTPDTELGLHWAGYIEVSDAYNWDPVTQIIGVSDKDILGVEAPLWTETVLNFSDIEFMLFPRLPGIAEIGWSQAEARNWEGYKMRLANHGAYWKAIGLNFYRSPEIDWDWIIKISSK